ncbi:tetraprenyl-beta-curcumene synthase family protein [Dethiobacter alkaliphilus]|uniref:Tetraprenyl-beta-curcumene synthase n=1 Tax=Dethiobacter alkaliphilus AHT 1 TaxID=555088 RepID=C0GC36_DETAL|nr:tetraprenyl-beta-curcumene synthase family protein [Dethiobacter alkaliphilus]EEG78771.1 conserved hypothetical protein [Dethiobacter alkaliphilus AHT 1]
MTLSVWERSKDRAVIFPYIFRVFPMVEHDLKLWRVKASAIPDEELRRQALASMKMKRFHCQGGAIFSLYTGGKTREMVRFIVALQTISDYLDNLCDRVEGADDTTFRTLHQAMRAAVDTDLPLTHWYDSYPHQNDGGYLDLLVKVCRETVAAFPGYGDIKADLVGLVSLYSDLQVYKHMEKRLRVEQLVSWFEREKDPTLQLYWWEFAAATGSTLAMFALAAMASAGPVSSEQRRELLACYFPWVCGLHILLDYFIDLDEDREFGDLNFVSFYPTQMAMEEGLKQFAQEAMQRVETMPRSGFHRTVAIGLLAMYLSDPKASQSGRNKISQQLLRYGGTETFWLYKVCLALRSKGII